MTMPDGLRIAAIVPAIDEAAAIEDCIGALGAGAAQGVRVIVVDGGSRDATPELARAAGAIVAQSPRGRALQMNAGARLAGDADVLVFVHADTRMPPGWPAAIESALRGGARWGRFDVRLDSARPMLRVVESMMNWRSRVTGICTGDQAIFVSRAAWTRAGGFAGIPLMEDVELSRRYRRTEGAPAALRACVSVSARRWERDGVWRTILQMMLLRAMYFFGASADSLHRIYYGSRS